MSHRCGGGGVGGSEPCDIPRSNSVAPAEATCWVKGRLAKLGGTGRPVTVLVAGCAGEGPDVGVDARGLRSRSPLRQCSTGISHHDGLLQGTLRFRCQGSGRREKGSSDQPTHRNLHAWRRVSGERLRMGLADVGTSAVLHFAFLASVVIGVLAALEEAEQLPGEIGGEELHSRILRREPDLHSLVDASFRVKVREVLATAQAGSFNLPIEIPKSQLFFSGCSAQSGQLRQSL